MSGKIIFRNATQDLLMMEFMIANPDFTRGMENRVVTAEKWEELLKALNSAGPPVKTIQAWKKIRANRIVSIRSKLAKSPSGDNLCPLETKVASICGLLGPPQGVVRSTRIKKQPVHLVLNEPQVKKKTLVRQKLLKKKPIVKKQPDLLVLNEPLVKKKTLGKQKFLAKKPIVKNESLSDDEGEWEDVDTKPLHNQQPGPMPKILQTLQTMTSQQAEHFRYIEEIEIRKLKVTKAIMENIAKMVNK
ncbi:uncharacterized protein [Drosophila kikkawai]|uniref:Uncharacterized protein LOC108072916 n=1 Tax=Drosophila kikkawai TaxID=30033 RepID=A0A6P4IB13_DROKI|nr:uncharacterized protein LOC108072916 [Drosophila kikkawai]XP_017019739.1 uncharacterized protein LOC108072916 [Drosophila kikkawai]XP_017019740.1 uncharacterized protein LOC108072916 [Drosophila kikkawai]XP_017019741.1 uncharacterized protein LOC108072916 [Drosophila kikkawai]XP_017019742.1 uncharacterized protein LOC108072916 [Drosophila kikkawai]XP_017019743.1 uncharacterized protein LOC108072916 [Drosophila kikkawai]XP_017019745.1 uncharacterized protein LOC108072916 [Drosophila kikkawa